MMMTEKKKYCCNCFIFLPLSVDTCNECGFTQSDKDSPLYLQPPFRLNNQYIIGRVLGHGGFAITYLAYDSNLSIRVAIKEYFPIEYANRHSDGATVSPFGEQATELFNLGKEKFINEARLLTQFRSPNIIKIRQFFKAWNTGYFVMEYLEGDTLTQYIHKKGGKLTFAETRQLLLPLLSALEEIHQKGVFHRDIKPDNIYITQKGEPILLDFGTARQSVSGRTTNLTSFLTPGFAPMEQYSANGIHGPWTDIYSMAATVYYALTGEHPPTPTERITGDAELIPPSQQGSDIPKQEESWLLKALELKWSLRPDSIQSWRALIEPSIHMFKPTPEFQAKLAEENFIKTAILPKLTKKILTRRDEEEIYASAAFMEIPLDKLRDLIETEVKKTGSERRNMTPAEEEAIRLTQALKQREEDLQRKEEELRQFEVQRNKEEELWWEAEFIKNTERDQEREMADTRRLQENQRLSEALIQKEAELQRREAELQALNAKLKQKATELTQREEALKQREIVVKTAAVAAHALKEESDSLADSAAEREQQTEELDATELNAIITKFSGSPKSKPILNQQSLNQHYAQIIREFATIQPSAQKLLAANLISLPLRLSNSHGMDFVLIYPALEGAGFMLYQDLSVSPGSPPFQTTLTRPFYLQTTPVTQQQWQSLMKNNPACFQPEPNAPVESVSWDDCQLLTHRLNLSQEAHYRLPTEIEWEFSCRAGTRSPYAFDHQLESLSEHAWYSENARQKTHPVAQKKPNPLGLMDMQGNVREWVQDSYECLSGTEQHSAAEEPKRSLRVVRGGGWDASARDCQSESRAGEKTDQRLPNLGFRLVIEVK